MTEFGPAEQSRLAELLGDERKNCSCMSYSNSPLPYCICCGGTGKTGKRIPPTGLALIEACRKRGVQISVDTFGENYEVECFQGGKFVFRTECQFEDLESAIAIAALKGLESLENTNECKVK